MNNTESRFINSKPVLVIMHRHYSSDKIAELENLYDKRFSHIHHLIPFYEKQRDPNPAKSQFNIIPVYDNYHHHQSFIANGLSHYYDKDATHYIFTTDDFQLNLEINENNYQQFFNLTNNSAFIENLDNLDNAYSLLPWGNENSNSSQLEQWEHSVEAYNFSLNTKGLKWPEQLVNHIEAMQRFKQNNLSIDHIDIKKAVRRHKKGIKAKHPAINKSIILRAILEYWVRGKDSYRPYKLAYPLARGSSDIVIIPNSSIHRFATHCGIFAAYNLFHEIAIPTATILTTDNITQANKIKYK